VTIKPKTIKRTGIDGETKWKVSFPKLVKGRKMVMKRVKREIAIKEKPGLLVFKKKWEVLIENMRAISVKMLSINQRVWSKDG